MHHANGEGEKQHLRKGPPTRPPAGDSFPKTESQKKKTPPEIFCEEAKLYPCSMMPLVERQQPMQIAMSGLLGERFVHVVGVFVVFVGELQFMEVTGYNTHVNDRRCAGGFVRVRGRCLGAVGWQSM